MKKITLCLMIILTLIVVPKVTLAATATVTTQEQFVENVEKGNAVTISKEIGIKLEKDLTITEKVTISNKVTLDLNGHAVKLNGKNAQFFITSKKTLIIKDSVGTGLITNAEATAYNSYPIQVVGNCEINGGTLENALPNLKTVYVQSGATCTLNNGTIKNSYEKGGRAVNISNGTFIMNGGKVENKARGDGLVPAIEGHKVIMTGGKIEAAGIGITATGKSVEITGGTIEAGLFGIYTRYAIIKPAEGKEVSISAERAAVIAYSKPATGDGNVIYGGNFNGCPVFETKGYQASDSTNLKICGGVYTHEVPAEFVAPGYLVNKDGDKYKVELNTPNIVDDEIKSDKEVEMEVFPETKEQLKEIFKKEISENESIQDALLEGKKVDIHIQLEKVEEEDINEEEINKIKETSKDKKIAKVYDITLVVKADGTQIDTISETSSKLKFKVLIPEDLLKDNRTFFMYRYHNGKVEEITGEIDEDNYFVFESDRFSTYVLAYEDKVEEPTESGQGTAKPEDKDEEVSEDKKDEILEDNQEEITEEDKKDEVLEDNQEEITEEDKKDEVLEDNQEEITEEDKKDEVLEDNKEVVTKEEKNVPKTGDAVVFYIALAVISVFGIAKLKKANTSKSKH